MINWKIERSETMIDLKCDIVILHQQLLSNEIYLITSVMCVDMACVTNLGLTKLNSKSKKKILLCVS